MVYDAQTPVAHLQIDLPEANATEAQVTIMVNPAQHRCGYGRRTLRQMLTLPELAFIKRYFAWIEPDNTASVGLFVSVGFRALSTTPDDTGYIEYEYTFTD